MGLIEKRSAGRIHKLFYRRAVIPVNAKGKGIERSGIGNGSRQGSTGSFVDISSIDAAECRGKVGNGEGKISSIIAKVIVNHSHNYRIEISSRVAGVVVKILMGFTEKRGAGWIDELFGRRTVAPVNAERKGVQCSRIGNGSRQGSTGSFIDIGREQIA